MCEYLYVGMTSGPLLELMDYARATKEHWLASFMFSKYSQHIVQTISERLSATDAGYTLLSPALSLEQTRRANPMAEHEDIRQLRIGLYSDRIFFRVSVTEEENTRIVVDEAIGAAKNMLAQVVAKIVHQQTNPCAEAVDTCLKTVESVVYTECIYRKANRLPLKEMNMALDERELFAGDRLDESAGSGDEWTLLFDKKKLCSEYCDWISDSDLHGADIERVAGTEHEGYRKTQASNYYAVIVADGDGVGTVLGNTSELGEICDSTVMSISKGLLIYANRASLEVLNYDSYAYPVYFGGDDMECFVPLYSMENDWSFLRLIQELDEHFDAIITGKDQEAGNKGVPCCENCTTSYGINIVYFKYPLNKAIQEAHDLLSQAKESKYGRACRNSKDDSMKKNTVHIQLRKHSGQTSRIRLSKADIGDGYNAWNAFQEYMELKESETIVHRIHYRLMAQKALMLSLVQLESVQKRTERIRAWLENQQEETPISPDYYEKLANLLIHLWECRLRCDKTSEEQTAYLNNVDGVFRLGELMDLHAPQTRKRKKEDGAS